MWPTDKALGVRVSATDYIPHGLPIEDVCDFVAAVRDLGCDFVDVSGGGVAAAQQIALTPGYQVDYATAIKKTVGLPTFAVGLITNPTQANEIITSGRADGIALARAFLRNPRWVWDAAEELGAEVFCPPRCAPAPGPVAGLGVCEPPSLTSRFDRHSALRPTDKRFLRKFMRRSGGRASRLRI